MLKRPHPQLPGNQQATPQALASSKVVKQGSQPPLKHLLDGLQQWVVDNVKSFIQRMAGQLLQTRQQVQLLNTYHLFHHDHHHCHHHHHQVSSYLRNVFDVIKVQI